MTRLMIDHATTYHYRSTVSLGPHRLMLRPRETRDLHLVSFDLELSPAAELTWSHDVSGNAIAEARFAQAADRLSIRSRALVDLSAPVWPVFAIAAEALSWPFAYAPDDRADLGALLEPQYADPSGRLSAWVGGFVMSAPTDTLSLLKDIANGVATAISYQSRETEGTQGPLETLDRGWGSCRDLAVLMAEAVRTLGFGARLVSGYLYEPQGASSAFATPGSTHAWVEVFVPGAGWIAFDPTNRTVGSANLIPVAVARRISQVSPVSGSYHGTGGEPAGLTVDVGVSRMTCATASTQSDPNRAPTPM